MKKVFSFDAETDGLWGKPWAIGAIVLDESGRETARFAGRLPDDVVTDPWVRDNILPACAEMEVTHTSYAALLADFSKFYLAQKAEADVVAHMGYIVESGVLRDMHAAGLIGDWDGPYPLLDIAGNLQQAGHDPTSVDTYVTETGLKIGDEFAGGTHNPLYDAVVAAVAYRHLRAW